LTASTTRFAKRSNGWAWAMSDTDRHLTWENFEAHFRGPGRPALHRVPGDPAAFLFVDPGGTRIGIRVAINPGDEPRPSSFSQIDVRKILQHGEHMLEVSCAAPSLFKEFFLFTTNLADLVQVNHTPPLNALEIAVRSWNRLLQKVTGLSEEEELGLIGELWLLERLLAGHGPEAIASWVGPAGENHDFRFGSFEIEVKTTSQADRVHLINGVHQLEASQGHDLFLLSVHLQMAGGQTGFSLCELFARCRAKLDTDGPSVLQFNRMLDQLGVSPEDEPRYQRRFNMRSHPVLVDVVAECPRLTAELLRGALTDAGYQRLRGIRYGINVDGLGAPDGAAAFARVIPDGHRGGD